MKRSCLFCGEEIDVRDSYQEPVCKEPSSRCQKLRDDAKAKFLEQQKKETLSAVHPVARSEQSERYGPDLRNDDNDIVDPRDVNKPEIRVEGKSSNVAIIHDIGPDKKKSSAFHTPAFPLTPTGNPLAPFGYDDNGKPIKAMRTDREIHAAQLESHKPARETCRHKNDPAHCAICKGERGEPLPQKKAVAPRAPLITARHENDDIRSARDKILRNRRLADLNAKRQRLLADWEKLRQKLTATCDALFKRWCLSHAESDKETYEAACEELTREASKATPAIAAIADQIEKLSFVRLREELGIPQTTIVEWLDLDRILRDSWTETRLKTRVVKREIKPVEQPADKTPREKYIAVPEHIQNLKRASRNAGKDNPEWTNKQVRQYRYELKKEIEKVQVLLKEQARKPKSPVAREPRYETVVEDIPGTEYEVECCGENIFVTSDVIGYKDMVEFRRPRSRDFDGFENDVIRRACQVGVFKPSAEAVRRFPELKIRVQANSDGDADSDNSRDHELQDKAILKGQVGGMQFIGAGWKCNPRTGAMTRRETRNFNQTRNLGGASGRGSGPDDYSSGSFGDLDTSADLEGDES